MKADWGDIFSIFKIINKQGTLALLSIPSIYLLVKSSNILDEKESKDHPRMYKALVSDEIKFDKFIYSVLSFTTFIRILRFVFKVMWIPFKLAILFYFLKLVGYVVSYLYQKINNLSLGLVDWYFKLIIEFLSSL